DVTINGNFRVAGGLSTFFRSLTNMRINPIQTGMPGHTLQWRTSQAAPLRRMDITGNLLVGGAQNFGTELSNSRLSGQVDSSNTWVADNPRENGQNHYVVRDSEIGSWRGRASNFVYTGVSGAP